MFDFESVFIDSQDGIMDAYGDQRGDGNGDGRFDYFLLDGNGAEYEGNGFGYDFAKQFVEL